MKKISLLLLASLLVTGQAFANTGTTSTGINLLSDLNTLIAQYETQLKYLQAENAVLRNEVSKAGIKIPLSEFSGSVLNTTQTTNTGNTASNTEAKAPVKKTVSGEMEIALSKIEKEHGKRYRGFIAGILPNWTAIKAAYKLPADADILGYEFVQKGDNDHVFVDISFGGRTASATGVYDAKILYQYHTKTFARKLVGLFIYDTKAKYYVTKTGNNPFAGVPRTFVAHPQIDLSGEAVESSTSSTTGSGGTTTSTPPPSTVTLADIEKAYTDKRYLSVITLSNSYLTSNPATYDLLRIRYRTYFIIGKYTESLGEIEKIKALGRLDKSVACDAQVIATYGKNTDLVNTYTSICKAK